jgi:alkaline phosphatase D
MLLFNILPVRLSNHLIQKKLKRLEAFMTKIAIASCCKISGYKSVENQTAWQTIESKQPDLLLLLGDNVYMRQRGARWQLDHLEGQYQKQFAEPHFASLLSQTPFMATWDDHDFGPNDSRGDTNRDRPYRERSRDLFHRYMGNSINNNRPEIYCSHVINDVKIIMLDSRYYKTNLFPQPNPTILGAQQEEWLWRELDHNHRFTVVGCGTCLEKGAERDKWSAYQAAYSRLMEKLRQVPRLLFVAGDIHRNAFYNRDGFFEVISSGIGRKENGKPLNNYGIIEFGANTVEVKLRGTHYVNKQIQISDWTEL